MKRSAFVTAFCFVLLAPTAANAQIVLDGEVPDTAGSFFFLPFEVPEGTVEIEVSHDDLSEENILDWGLDDPDGFRGWGGGNVENAVVGVDAASRSYLPGPITPGEWSVVVGKAKVVELPARYHVEITLRTEATLVPMPERSAYAPSPALATGARFYAGDFHVHSRESGDANPTIDEIAAFARSRGLDFIELSEHNTTSQLSLMNDAQSRHPDLLLVPGVEFTTYAGHGNGIGATEWVSHRIGEPGITIDGAIDAFHAQNAIFSINHAALDLGSLCIGCAWEHDVAPEDIDAIEIGTGAWSRAGSVFTPLVIALWEDMLDTGAHIAPIGGSDDHQGGTGTGGLDSPIGSPTTMVFAEELTADAIVEGVRRGRTVVKLEGPDDPMVELFAGDARLGDTVEGPRATFTARVENGAGSRLRFVVNGEPVQTFDVDADPFEVALDVDAPYGTREGRVRAELLVAGALRVVTHHIFMTPQPGTPPPTMTEEGGGCGCAATRPRAVTPWLSSALLLAALALRVRRTGRARWRSSASG
jgi:hypothetical protein